MHTKGKMQVVGEVKEWDDGDSPEHHIEYVGALEIPGRLAVCRFQSYTPAEPSPYPIGAEETQANAVRLAQLWNLADGLDMADIAAALEALRK